MAFPVDRPRRLRRSPGLRRIVRETRVSSDCLVLPLFAVTGKGRKEEIPAMPGCFHFSVDRLVDEAAEAFDCGVPAVLLFGVPDSKDEKASAAYDDEGPVQRAVAALKQQLPSLVVMTDVCLCAYMSHGHCGVLKGGAVVNDPSLELLAGTALSHARAGADVVAPSDMMDGRVAAIRRSLDENGFIDTAIMSYSVKYASSFYGPFRDAAGSAPSCGDRRGYQMDPANLREARTEVVLDLEEGADIVMVKPALAYLDVIARVRSLTNRPLAAYNVSGEYSMVKAAAEKGWIDEEKVVKEILTGMKRAGADILITYYARQAAQWFSAAGLGEG